MLADLVGNLVIEAAVGEPEELELHVSQDRETSPGLLFPAPAVSGLVCRSSGSLGAISRDENPNGAIFLLDDADTITKKFRKAVTDSGTEITFDDSRPAIKNLLTIYQLMTGKTAEECEANFVGKGYGHFKTETAEAVIEFLKPFQQRVKDYTDEDLKAILKTGAEKAKTIARETLNDVYAKMGII